MAYVAPAGTTKLIDGASVAAGQYSAAALVAVPEYNGERPVVFYVACDKAHTIEFGTAAQSTQVAAELDSDPAQTRSGIAALATYGARRYTFWPDASGYAWCRVKNDDGAAPATVTVYGGQL